MNTMFLDSISSFFVCAGLIIALALTFSLIRNKQPMKIMNAVWILTGLWGHYFALFAYYGFGFRRGETPGSQDSGKMMNMGLKMNMSMDMPMNNTPLGMDMDEDRPRWQSIALSALHCGAGCTLADILGEWFTYYVPLQIGGSLIAGSWMLDFVLALIIGVFFQFSAIREMEDISFGKAVSRAFKADFFSLTAWQVGMYGWMAIAYFVIFADAPLEKTSWTFWFMMQIAMLFGFIFAYPMNVLLIRLGIKKAM